MSAIQQLSSAQQVTAKMITQAIYEADGDAAKMTELQGVVASMQSGRCEDPRQWDRLLAFVHRYHCDSFEIVPNQQNPAPHVAQVTEARITKLRVEKQRIQRQPPAPPPAPFRRDPLNITGHAEPGARVDFYNASLPGRPPLGSAVADAHGDFVFELTDESKFQYGDQIGLVVADRAGSSRPIVVPTEPFEIHQLDREVYDYRGTLESSSSVQTLRQLDRNTDTRKPFYQDGLVGKTFHIPRAAGEPHMLELQGKDDAVEPNSTLIVRGPNGEELDRTTADELGRFAVKARGFQPGDLLRLEVRDIHGVGTDFTYRVPELTLDAAAFSAGVRLPPSPRLREARQVEGEGPPFLRIETKQGVTDPYGVLMLRDATNGQLVELKADGRGRIDATVGGFDVFDVIEVVSRDQNANIQDRVERFVILPSAIDGSCLVPVGSLDTAQPDVAAALERIQGPPVDMLRNGVADPHGPFLRMPDVRCLPPFAQLEVRRDGEVIQTLRADANGTLDRTFLRGVHVGDVLGFRVLDAAGRAFPEELQGWSVPDAGAKSAIGARHVHAEDMTVAQALAAIGTGTVDLHHEWLLPFTLGTGPMRQGPTVTTAPAGVELHYPVQSFSAAAPAAPPDGKLVLTDLPPFVVGEMSLPADTQALEMTLSERNGTSVLNVMLRTSGGGTSYLGAIGVDYVMGLVNQGDPNNVIQVPAELPQLTAGFRGAIALAAAAYDHGKEPGDAAYDRAMGAVKMFLYAFDRLAVQNAANADVVTQIKKAAADAMPKSGFLYELIDPKQVPPTGYVRTGQVPSQTGSGARAILAQRIAERGEIGAAPVVAPQPGAGDYPAPKVDAAIVVLPANLNAQVWTPPLRVQGRANPGDIVQVFNGSSGKNELLAEAAAGPDGTFTIVSATRQVRRGDQLSLVALTPDGKRRSAASLVPTDGYAYGNSVDTAAPVRSDDRPPFLQLAKMSLVSSTYDAAGNVRAGGPWYVLTGESGSVEGNSKVTVRSATPDGVAKTRDVTVGPDGSFLIEFPATSLVGFEISVTDRNGATAKSSMRAPGLTAGVRRADKSTEGAWNQLTLTTADGLKLTGSIVGTDGEGMTFGQKGSAAIDAGDRLDGFVDLVFRQAYAWTQPDGNRHNGNLLIKVKVPEAEAARLRITDNEKLSIDAPALASILPGGYDTYASPDGEAVLVARDYGAPKQSSAPARA